MDSAKLHPLSISSLFDQALNIASAQTGWFIVCPWLAGNATATMKRLVSPTPHQQYMDYMVDIGILCVCVCVCVCMCVCTHAHSTELTPNRIAILGTY